MKILIPVTVSDSMLLSSSLAEADAPAWSGATTYALAAQVMKGHKVWESAIASNLNNDPEADDGTNWVLVGPTNRWAAFDEKPSTKSTATGSMTWTLQPGVWVSDIALIAAAGGQARVRVIASDGTTVLYDQTKALPGLAGASFHAWFFRDRGEPVDADLLFEGLPRRLTGTIEVSVTGGGSVSLGVLALGVIYAAGETLAGSNSDLIDYSKVTTDEFGETSIKRRARARRTSYQVLIPTADLPRLRTLRERISSVPVVAIGATSDAMRAALLTYGLVRSMPIEIPGPTVTTYTLEMMGFA